MKKLTPTLTLLLLSVISFGQDVKIDIYKTPGTGSAEWLLLDMDKRPLFTGTGYHRDDTVSLTLEKNRSYYLQVGIKEIFAEDTSLYNIYIDGQQAFGVSTVLGYGDHFIPFNTGYPWEEEAKIIGGEDADIADYPWQAYILYSTGGYVYSCGGTIIGDKWILTAAHCTTDKDEVFVDAGDMRVYTGSSAPYSGDQYQVKTIIRHENYDKYTYANDIALLKLETEITTANATPIKLLTRGDASEGYTDPGVMSTVTGWGLISVDPEVSATTLQMVNLPIVSRQVASQVWGGIPANVIMAGYNNGNKDACRGDSGGPLVVPVGDEGFKVAGIVSWGNRDCDTYGAYTEVSAFEEWIRNNTGIIDFAPATPEGETSVCQGTATTIYTTDPLAGADSYEWEIYPENAGTITGSGTTGTLTWNHSFTGDIKVKVRAVNGEGVSSWSRLDVAMCANTAINSQSGNVSICVAESFSLNVDATGHNLTYKWYKDGVGLADSRASLSRINTSEGHSGDYYCVATGTCGTEQSDNIRVDVNTITKVLATTKDTTVSFGSSPYIRVNAVGHNLNYQWKKNGEPLEGTNNYKLSFNNINANDIGMYNCTVTGTCGTVSSAQYYLYVNKEADPELPEIYLWPTITSGYIKVAISDNSEYSVKIFNSIGKIMYEEKGLRHQAEIDMSHYPRGIYIVQIFNNNIRKAQKVIVDR
jgi:secreted trypsin-like serine protease